jgi:hypothetical protein
MSNTANETKLHKKKYNMKEKKLLIGYQGEPNEFLHFFFILGWFSRHGYRENKQKKILIH